MGQNVSFDELYHRCFNITSIRNSPHLFVLPSHPITHPHFPLKYEAFNIQCDDIFSSVYIPIHILSYQPFCYSCLNLKVIFHFVAANILLQRCEQNVYKLYIWQSMVHQHLHYNRHQHCFFSYVILLYVKILPGSFLGVFAKLWKASISFIMSVRPSFLLPAFDNHIDRIFMKFVISEIFETLKRKFNLH
jgi:hypothetical protein